MRNLPNIPLAIFSVLLVFLFLAACDDDPSTGTECSNMFGASRGPITEELSKRKVRAFKDYNTADLSLSEAVKLENVDQLEKSIEGNLPFPYGVRRQSYNYVIAENCDILVAKWSDDRDLKVFLLGTQCPGGRNFVPRDQKDRMINLFPEELDGRQYVVKSDARKSPCWLKKNETGDGRDGLLDAISKHFMLAQGEESTIKKISEFEEDDDRGNAKVAYAGELIVDLGSCTYSVNNNSGTYQPLDEDLPDVNEFFAEQLGSMKISNVSPWCP